MAKVQTIKNNWIFVDAKGHRVPIFLETTVRDRAKLAGTIRRHCGELVVEPLKADILIAEGGSEDTRDFLEAWGKDKVILDTSWIYDCIKSQKFIGEDQSWGGHRLDLKGLGGVDDQGERDETEEEAGQDWTPMRLRTSPQPRKQIPSSQKRPVAKSKAASNYRTHPSKSLSPTIKISDSPPPPKKRRINALSNDSPQSADAASYPFPISQTSSFPSPNRNYRASPYPPSSSSTLPQSTQDIYTAVGHQVLSSPDLARFIGPVISQLFSQAPVGDPETVATQLRDLAEVISASNPPSQQYSQMPPYTQQPPSYIDSSTSRSDTTAPNPLSPRSENDVESTLLTSGNPLRGVSLSSFSDNDDTQRTMVTRQRSKLPKKKNESEKAPPFVQQQCQGFFSDSNGKPSKFYVDMDLKNRRELVNIVRKNGGVIVNLMSEGDYIVLNNRSPQFLKKTSFVPLDKVTVSARWLEECAQEKSFVPLHDYLIEITSPSKKQRRKPSSTARKNTPSSMEYESEESPSYKLSKPSSQRMRSPSPPVHIATMSNSNHTFTRQDKEWFLRYIQFKLKQDPNISLDVLINAVTEKSPHHTKDSWLEAYHQKWATEVKALRTSFGLAT